MNTPEEIKEEIIEQIEGKKDLLRALLLCLLAVIVVRSFLFEPFKIPSSSMVPSLKIGDHIFVSKFSYGLSLPFTKIDFVRWSEPKRGDVIVFLFPKDESLHYVKRVLGVPGDKVEFRGKEIYINDAILPKEPIVDAAVLEKINGAGFAGETFFETIGSVKHYVNYSTGAAQELTRTNLVETVPPDHFFVAGDNRDDSYDSRSWGMVPRENIKGKAQVIWLSLDNEAPWGSIDKIRWKRFGTPIR